jgi:tellurite resistance protein
MWPLRVVAETVREDRRSAAADNAFVTAERAVSEQIEQALDQYREIRDRMQELTFKAIYNSPFVEALAGLRAPHADAGKPRARDEHAERVLKAEIEAIKAREEKGGFAQAVLRIMLAVAKAEHMLDARGFRLAQRIKQEHPDLRRFTREQMKAAAKEEALMLRFDQERALAALPVMLPTEGERREAVAIVRRIGYADGEITPENEAVLAKIERILGLDQGARAPAAKEETPPRRIRATAK